MDGMIRGGAQHFLDYDEVEEVKNENSELAQTLVNNIKETLLEQIRTETPNTINYDRAFRIQVRLLDDMNLVGKLEEIPIMDVPLRVPDQENIYISNKPLKFRDRIKILIRGRLDGNEFNK